MTTAIEQTVETYGILNWGAGYFDVNRKGNLVVRPGEGDSRSGVALSRADDQIAFAIYVKVACAPV